MTYLEEKAKAFFEAQVKYEQAKARERRIHRIMTVLGLIFAIIVLVSLRYSAHPCAQAVSCNALGQCWREEAR